MPDIPYYREWCQTCKDYTLHDPEFGEEMKCRNCSSTCVEVDLSEIPVEKVEQQRKRYIEARDKNFSVSRFLSAGNPLDDMFQQVGWKERRVIEADAGQKAIDREQRDINQKKFEKRQLALHNKRKEAKKFEGLTRNDPCACGSGIKYKKCCLTRIKAVK